VHADLAVGPVKQGLPVEPVASLRPRKLARSLAAGVGGDDLLGGPIEAVGDEQRPAQRCISSFLESGVIDLKRKRLPPGSSKSDSGPTRRGRGLTASGESWPRSPPGEAITRPRHLHRQPFQHSQHLLKRSRGCAVARRQRWRNISRRRDIPPHAPATSPPPLAPRLGAAASGHASTGRWRNSAGAWFQGSAEIQPKPPLSATRCWQRRRALVENQVTVSGGIAWRASSRWMRSRPREFLGVGDVAGINVMAQGQARFPSST